MVKQTEYDYNGRRVKMRKLQKQESSTEEKLILPPVSSSNSIISAEENSESYKSSPSRQTNGYEENLSGGRLSNDVEDQTSDGVLTEVKIFFIYSLLIKNTTEFSV